MQSANALAQNCQFQLFASLERTGAQVSHAVRQEHRGKGGAVFEGIALDASQTFGEDHFLQILTTPKRAGANGVQGIRQRNMGKGGVVLKYIAADADDRQAVDLVGGSTLLRCRYSRHPLRTDRQSCPWLRWVPGGPEVR